MAVVRTELALLACLAAVAWWLPRSTECAPPGRFGRTSVQAGASLLAGELATTSPGAGVAARTARRSERPLTTSVLTLTEGILGGIIGPARNFEVAFSYDWNRARYRVVVRGWRRAAGWGEGPRFRAAELSEAQFRRVLDGVRDLGLADLPLERPVACEDLYGRNLGIQLLHGGLAWHNRAPGGCVQGRSEVQPTPAERERFDAVVAFVEERLASLELLPASVLDDAVAIVEPQQAAEAFPRAIERLRADGLADLVDFNRVLCTPGRGASSATSLRFALRGRQHAASLSDRFWPERVLVVVWSDLLEVRPVGDVRSSGPTAADGARRATYLAAHPDLAAPLRELIARGWIDQGMTTEMVVAAWGEPDDRSELRGTTTLTYRGGPARRETALYFREGALLGVPDRIHQPLR